MKKSFTPYDRIPFASLFCYLLLFPYKAQSGEFAIINTTFTYSANANAFSCHESPPYGNGIPTNWYSPNNYWDGEFWAYYEVIDVPTSEPFGFQMGVFQYMPSAADWDGHNYYETCSFSIPELRGAGDVVTFNYGAPSGWWQHPNGAVDFSRVNDFESVGPVMYSLVPGAKGGLSPTSGGGSDAAWAIRDNWFPCTIRVIVVAVSSGSTFSGWDNYISGGGGCTPVQQPKPSYGIDYEAETTNKAVPASDEYSSNASMSGAVSGNGQKINLTPGQDVYFRTKKIDDCYLASDIQHLVVPARPAKPTFSVDFFNEKTAENVGTNIFYTPSSSFLNPVSGTGEKISLTPGQDLYLWIKPTSGSFASMDHHLVVPARPSAPSVTLDYINERTSSIPTTQEWSANASMTSATAGDNAPIVVTPGTDLYFRAKATSGAFSSSVVTLDVPNRPPAPVYEIDYAIEKTITAVPATEEYSTHSDMTSPSPGAGAVLTVTPGTDLYFRTKATASDFKSAISHLVVPVRPALVYTGLSTVTSPTITMRADLTVDMNGFDLTDLSVTNGTAQNLRENNTFDVIADSKGDVKVIIPYNAFSGASFVSNEVVVYYNVVTGIQENENEAYRIYPNPSRNGIIFIQTSYGEPFTIDIYTIDGHWIKTVDISEGISPQLDLRDLQKGVYFLNIKSEINTAPFKVILE